MFFRLMVTIGSLFGFVTGGLDLAERFGVPVDSWLRALPGVFGNIFDWFGFQIDQIAIAVFGAPEPEMVMSPRSQSVDGGDTLAEPSAMFSSAPSTETLLLSGGFTLVMFIILMIAIRRR